MSVPTDRDHASIVALVEGTLVGLTYEVVGAIFVSRHVLGTKRTQYVDDAWYPRIQAAHSNELLFTVETV